ncbi:LysR family transcriptional regulator [Oxalobacteraceae bacterium CAVE-383]|nr:LysR family transcriptional regulator [Oxalobacteraceae bacterium CAVE-383]
MKIEANDLLLFAKVVDEGSFNRAAERLGLPKSTVSRRIASLETALGERLLLRTTRQLHVTDFGASVLEHAHQVAAEVESATSLAHHRQLEPTGRLRISMPHDLAADLLAPMLARFAIDYPAVTLEMDLSARRVDLIGENFDLAIRVGGTLDDTSLAARKVADFSDGLYASPAYIARRGMPLRPDQLLQHDALLILGRNGKARPWRLLRGEEIWEEPVPARAVVNSPGVLLRMACSGAGIVAMADEFTEPYLRSGQLLPVLPDWRLPENTAWAVFPGRRLMPRRTRVFLDALEQYFSPAECEAHRVRIRQGKAQYRYEPDAIATSISASMKGSMAESASGSAQTAAVPRGRRKTQPA